MKVMKMKLFRVNMELSVSFGVIIDSDPTTVKKFTKTIDFSVYNGTETITINANPFLTFTITKTQSDKVEGMPDNVKTFTVNRKDLYLLLRSLNQLYSIYTKEETLFFYDDYKRLHINNDLCRKYQYTVPCGNKVLHIGPAIYEKEEGDGQYEACYIAVNSMDLYAMITYRELGYLIYELSHIDMEGLSLQLIQTGLVIYGHKSQ